MPELLPCPSCGGLRRTDRSSCPHCAPAASRSRAVALGLTAAVGFGALVASCSGAPVAAYGICMLPDGGPCGQAQQTDAGHHTDAG